MSLRPADVTLDLPEFEAAWVRRDCALPSDKHRKGLKRKKLFLRGCPAYYVQGENRHTTDVRFGYYETWEDSKKAAQRFCLFEPQENGSSNDMLLTTLGKLPFHEVRSSCTFYDSQAMICKQFSVCRSLHVKVIDSMR